jgi:hypothetical protein
MTLQYETQIAQLKLDALKLNLKVEILLKTVHNDALDLACNIIEEHENRWITKGIRKLLGQELKSELMAAIKRRREILDAPTSATACSEK